MPVKDTYDITVTMLKRKVYLTTDRQKHCIVQLYNTKYDMQRDYIKYCKERKQKPDSILGASTHYWKYSMRKSKEILSGETGIVFLCVPECGAGIVTHELMHACLWAWKHSHHKEQYPIVIKNMKEEEQLLRNHTYAVTQFYNWFWKVAKKVTTPNKRK